MKKFLCLFLCLTMIFGCLFTFISCGDDDSGNSEYKVAMITDYGDITDQSFNQTTYEASKEFCQANNITFKYYKPTGNSTEARISSTNAAIADGYNVIVMPGYAFAETIDDVAPKNKDIKFIALDVALGDLLAAHYSDYDYNPANEKWADYKLPDNVVTFTFQEELSGYMAGYAAVKEGYKKLGFLGGMAVPAVIRFGYGFVQGANDAAKEMNIADQVSVNYVYGGQFYGDAAITAVMDTWYTTNKVEVVFACGGGIYSSACEAATKANVNGKVIGVDTDQSYVINNEYKVDGLCVTSAMKGLAPAVKDTLKGLIVDDKWSDYSGKIINLGLVSGTNPEDNYVQLPTATWTMTNFTKDDYKALVKKLFEKTITVSDTIGDMPETSITVTTQANIH